MHPDPEKGWSKVKGTAGAFLSPNQTHLPDSTIAIRAHLPFDLGFDAQINQPDAIIQVS